jgi:hypothetical protein
MLCKLLSEGRRHKSKYDVFGFEHAFAPQGRPPHFDHVPSSGTVRVVPSWRPWRLPQTVRRAQLTGCTTAAVPHACRKRTNQVTNQTIKQQTTNPRTNHEPTESAQRHAIKPCSTHAGRQAGRPAGRQASRAKPTKRHVVGSAMFPTAAVLPTRSREAVPNCRRHTEARRWSYTQLSARLVAPNCNRHIAQCNRSFAPFPNKCCFRADSREASATGVLRRTVAPRVT